MKKYFFSIAILTGIVLNGYSQSNSILKNNSCLGEKRKITVAKQMPYLQMKFGNAEGEVVLDFCSNVTSIDQSGFTGTLPKPLNGANIEYEKTFPFVGSHFNFWGDREDSVYILFRKSNVNGLGFQQAGIIGTDFFMEYIFTIDYIDSLVFRSKQVGFCTDNELKNLGFKPVSSKGYYCNDFSRLIDPNTTMNIPTVPIKIGGVSAVAQIDAGYDDGVYKHSVNINKPFFDALVSAGVVLEKIPSANSLISTCAGENETITAYKLGSGKSFEIIGEDGKPVLIKNDAYIFFKETPVAAQSCGGIGTWNIPAAQIGASFLVESKIQIYDPFSSRVWFYCK